MARVLIVGCGCRGRELADGLTEDGHAVRGTSRTQEGAAAIEQAGFEGVVADPDRLGTIMAALDGVSAMCWLLGSATGSAEQLAALHGPRLETMLSRLVDTPVRGFVYEASGSVGRDLLDQGTAAVNTAADTWSMPVVVAGPGTVRAGVAELLA